MPPTSAQTRPVLFVMGHSAGAYNAAMVALDARWLQAEGMKPSQLAGWIGLAGPYDFLPIGRSPDSSGTSALEGGHLCLSG
jgi:hypothetical protein